MSYMEKEKSKLRKLKKSFVRYDQKEEELECAWPRSPCNSLVEKGRTWLEVLKQPQYVRATFPCGFPEGKVVCYLFRGDLRKLTSDR